MRTTSGDPHVSRATRAAVYVFLAVFLICGLARIEAWPFTGFRMFSHVRERVQTWWSIRYVDATGAEHAMPFGRLDHGYQGWVHIAGGFAALTESQQLGVCRAYLDAVPGSNEIRFYSVERDLGVRPGGVSAPGTETLMHRCDADEVSPP